MWTQNIHFNKVNPEQISDEDDWNIYTPEINFDDAPDSNAYQIARENLNLLILYDDSEYMNFMMKTLRSKGVRIVDFPSVYEASTIIPFLLINDHSIIVMRNPKKDILNLLKLIIRKGVIFFKQ